MLDWSGRIDELHHFLARTYQLTDFTAVNILLAALTPCPHTRPPWLILESNWYSRRSHNAWFAFGGAWTPYSLGELRSLRPRQAKKQLNAWLEESPPSAHLFLEPDWEKLHRYGRFPDIRFLLGRSLRLRTMTPRTPAYALAVDEREQARRTDTLAVLTRQVIEDRVGARPPGPPIFREPPHFAYHAELLERLSPWYSDWNELLSALASLACHHAYLFGRAEVTEEDWSVLSRVAADSVPPWIQNAVRFLADHPADDDQRPASAAPGSRVQ